MKLVPQQEDEIDEVSDCGNSKHTSCQECHTGGQLKTELTRCSWTLDSTEGLKEPKNL